MDIVIDVVGEYVYTMAFNHYLIAPLSVTYRGCNVSQHQPLSTLALLFHCVFEECMSYTETSGVIDYSRLPNKNHVVGTLMYIKANECSQKLI